VLASAECDCGPGTDRGNNPFRMFTGRRRRGSTGSFAYMKQHQSEMANHLGDLVLDEGQGR